MTISKRLTCSATIFGFATLALVAAPLGLSITSAQSDRVAGSGNMEIVLTVATKAAIAKSENAGGNGGGNGYGLSGDGPAQSNNGNQGTGREKGVSASSLGRLNASHASDTAMLNAAETSTVGLIAAYAAAIGDGTASDVAAAAQALADAANKEITLSVVQDVNANLDIVMSDPDATALAEQAESLRTTPTE